MTSTKKVESMFDDHRANMILNTSQSTVTPAKAGIPKRVHAEAAVL